RTKCEHGRKKGWTEKAWKGARSSLRHSNANFIEQKEKGLPDVRGNENYGQTSRKHITAPSPSPAVHARPERLAEKWQEHHTNDHPVRTPKKHPEAQNRKAKPGGPGFFPERL